MAQPVKLNFKVYQGSTFQETLRWESVEKVYVPITFIAKAAPIVVTAPSHGIPVGWRAKLSSNNGMKEINSLDYLVVTATTTDTVTFNSVNAINFTSYVSGGVLEYNKPVDLAGFTARMQIRAKLEDSIVIKELTTENGGIVIDNTTKTIQLTISATDTAAFTFQTAVYSIELVNGSVVTPFAGGTMMLVKEVTR